MTTPPSRPRLAGHVLVEALIAQGVDTAFGVPGESYLAVLDGFHEHRDHIRFIACRHEGGAGFMAEAQGKLSGRPGVCLVTRGPGASNVAVALHTAFQDSTPMLVLIGQVASRQRDREAFQEVDYRQMFGPGTLGYAKWVGEIHDADRVPEYVARAFHTAMQGRPGPVVLALPGDMLMTPTDAPVLPRVEPALAAPSPEAIEAVRQSLGAAKRPFVIVGGGGWDAAACEALERFVQAWQLPVGCSFRFQDVLDNGHSSDAGDVGIGLAPALAKRIREADLVIAFGERLGEMTTSDYTLLEAPRPKQRLVHIHPGAEELGRVYAADVAVLASVRTAAPALAALQAPNDVPWSEWTRAAHADAVANRESKPIEPLDMAAVVRTVERALGPETVYTNGAGNFAGWLHRYHAYVGMRHAGRTQLGPSSGAMGYGVPAAIAAALLEPHRSAVVFAGDGDFLMTSQELATAMQHGVGQGKGKLLAIVVDNASYGTIRMHQEREFPGRVEGTALVNPDFGALARAYGWWAPEAPIERTDAFEPALHQALAAGRPALLHLKLDADVITSRTTLSAIRAKALQNTGG